MSNMQSAKDDLQKVFNRGQSNTSHQSSFLNDMKDQDTARQKPSTSGFNQGSSKRLDTYRTFKNLNTSVNKSFNLIDLSKKKHPQCEL